MTIEDLVRESWQTAQDKGFHDDLDKLSPRDASLIRLALIHTEVSEAAQEIKKRGTGDREAIGAELADVMIRVADIAGCLGIDLQAATVAKLEANRGRPYRYGTPDEVKG